MKETEGGAVERARAVIAGVEAWAVGVAEAREVEAVEDELVGVVGSGAGGSLLDDEEGEGGEVLEGFLVGAEHGG